MTSSDVPADMSSGGDTSNTDTSADTQTLADQAAAMCPSKTDMNVATPFSADQFCALFAQICSQITTGSPLLTNSTCLTTYAGWTSTGTGGPDGSATTGQQGCRSDHLCNAVRGTPTVHCWHAEGMSPPDGGGNPCP
jgi:hypothetical protein